MKNVFILSWSCPLLHFNFNLAVVKEFKMVALSFNSGCCNAMYFVNMQYKKYNKYTRAHCHYCIRSDTRRLISSSSAVFHRDAGRKSRLLIVAANEEQLIGDCLLTISWQRISSRHVHHAPLVWSSHRHRHILQYFLSEAFSINLQYCFLFPSTALSGFHRAILQM